MTEKQALRQNMRKERERASIIQMAELSARIGERVLAMREYKEARTILCYASRQSEVDTIGLIRQMLRDAKTVCLPKVRGDGVMDAVRLLSLDETVIGAFRILEPKEAPITPPEAFDLVLVPGVAFDRKGGRLGQGAGYFDRYLPRCRGLICALAFEFQVVKEIPQGELDVKMQRLITEKGMYDMTGDKG